MASGIIFTVIGCILLCIGIIWLIIAKNFSDETLSLTSPLLMFTGGIILFLGIAVICTAECPLNNYKNAVIVEKSNERDRNNYVVLELKKIKQVRLHSVIIDKKEKYYTRIVYVNKYDFNRYEVGDTIK